MPEIEEEINLIDIVRVLVNRRWLIIGVTTLCFAAAIVISLTLPKVYKVSFAVDVGMVQRGEEIIPIESPENIKSKVDMGYSYSAMQALNIPEDEFPDLLVNNPKKASVIEVAVKTSNTEEGQGILQYIKSRLLEDHGRVVGPYIENLKRSIKKLELSMSILDEENKLLVNQLKNVQKSMENSNIQASKVKKLNPELAYQKFTLQGDIRDNQLKKQTIELEKLKYESRLGALRETRVIKEPSYSEKPVSPKKKLIVVLGGVAGLMASIFLAFFMEFVERYRKEQAEGAGI